MKKLAIQIHTLTMCYRDNVATFVRATFNSFRFLVYKRQPFPKKEIRLFIKIPLPGPEVHTQRCSMKAKIAKIKNIGKKVLICTKMMDLVDFAAAKGELLGRMKLCFSLISFHIVTIREHF